MCGIGVCILKKNIHKNKIHEILPIINKVQNHRGPDYSGTYFENNIGLCHTRLSIIDLSEKANQPFQAEKGNFLIVYNDASLLEWIILHLLQHTHQHQYYKPLHYKHLPQCLLYTN